MNLHQEHHFETAICDHLAAHGWLYAEGDAAHYDRQQALYLPNLLAWVEETQPDSYPRLAKTHGAELAKRKERRTTLISVSVTSMISLQEVMTC